MYPSVVRKAKPEKEHRLFSLVESCIFNDINEVMSVNPSTITDECKYSLITGRAPKKSFNFPAKVYKDNWKKSGEMRRFCLYEWFHNYKFLAYSKASDGLFCLACTLFAMAENQGYKAKLLILQPYRNWKDSRSDLSHHAVLQFPQRFDGSIKQLWSLFSKPK